MYCADAVTNMLCVSREIAAKFLEMVRLEGDRAVVEVGIVQQDASAIDHHRVGLIWMALYEPFRIVRGHLYAV